MSVPLVKGHTWSLKNLSRLGAVLGFCREIESCYSIYRWEREEETVIYRELVHSITGPEKSQDLQLAAGDLREPMV